MPQDVKVNAVKLILEFATALENSKGIRKIVDEDGNMVVPVDRFLDFCHDLGIILGRVIRKTAEYKK